MVALIHVARWTSATICEVYLGRDPGRRVQAGSIHRGDLEEVDAVCSRALIIARGAEGSVMWAGDQGWFANAAKVEDVSRVGAGDSFMGGFTLALARGLPLEQALAHGAAAASAAVMTPGTQLCRREDFERLLGETRTIQL